MIRKDCEQCHGNGNITIDKNAKSYVRARKKIRRIDKTMTDADAEKILDDEITK